MIACPCSVLHHGANQAINSQGVTTLIIEVQRVPSADDKKYASTILVLIARITVGAV